MKLYFFTLLLIMKSWFQFLDLFLFRTWDLIKMTCLSLYLFFGYALFPNNRTATMIYGISQMIQKLHDKG